MLVRYEQELVRLTDEMTPDNVEMVRQSFRAHTPVLRDCVLYVLLDRAPGEVLDISLREIVSGVEFERVKITTNKLSRVEVGTLANDVVVSWHFHNKPSPPAPGAKRSLFKTRMSVTLVGVEEVPNRKKVSK